MSTTTSTLGSELRPSWLSDTQWPYRIEALPNGDTTVAYTDTGTGPPLVLVHTGMWSLLWRDLLARLRPEFRVIVIDAPGTGLSTGPSRPTINDAAAAIDAVVAALDLEGFVLGFHDLGGPTALTAAARWPERVTGLIAINSFGWQPHSRTFRLMLRIMGSAPMRELDVWTGWLPRASTTRFGVGRNWGRMTRRTFRKAMNHRGRRSFHHYLRSALRHDYTAVHTTVASMRRLPLLTVFGQRNDPLGFQPRWAKRFPDHTQVTVDKGYHFPMCDAPGEVADAVIRWYRTEIRPPAPTTHEAINNAR